MKTLLSIAFAISTFFACAQDQNIALHKPVLTSSGASTASQITDGIISRGSRWEAANGKAPHTIEVDLRKYYALSQIKIHSGIMDSEKRTDEMNQAAGFWSVKNFKLQYWDDANWSDFSNGEVHENRLTTAIFNFQPSVTTYKIRLVVDDGEPINIMEIEAFGKEAADMPAPPALDAHLLNDQLLTTPQDLNIKVTNQRVGQSMKYVGYNQGYYMPGSNVSGWVEYSNVNSFRVWATMNSFVPETAVQVDKQVSSIEEFDKRKNQLRAAPESSLFIKWNKLLPIYDQPDSSSTNAMVYNYAITELKRLKVDVILQMGSTDFTDAWDNKWKQWQRYYALAYHSAKKADVSMFAMQNEPNHRNSGPMKLDQWIAGMQIVSDAIHSAIEDVNRKYNKRLVAQFVGPVTAGQNTEWWAAISKAIRTDYHGKTIDHDLLNLFSTHSYNSPAVGYDNRVNNIRKIIEDNHPLHHELPIAYTEIGRWMNAYLIDKEETMDSPSLFTEWAGIYANNMKNNASGMWAFKFANTASGPYPRGIKSGHHLIWQGERIIEDAYTNIAKGKKVTSSGGTGGSFVTDGTKDDHAWISDTVSSSKWVMIELGNAMQVGSAVVYSGSAGGVYTAPDRIKNYSLQYDVNGSWKDIDGTMEKDNKYAQAFYLFNQPVTTSRVRFLSNDKSALKLREIKLFAPHAAATTSFDVSGIQRTGEVVRLFAKGFKDQHSLLNTKASVNDTGLDSYTSVDSSAGMYYMWLVQRNGFVYNTKIDLGDLKLAPNTIITGETVNENHYGEISYYKKLTSNQIVDLTLPPQTVMLLSIPMNARKETVINTAKAITVGPSMPANSKQLEIALNAASPDSNRVTYLQFNTIGIRKINRAVLYVKGYSNKDTGNFRFHVYAIPGQQLNNVSNWNTAPLLDKNEALITSVGTKAFVAGELAFKNETADHWLDVTQVIKAHPSSVISFVLVRETRQLGDDEDKGRSAFIDPQSTKLLISL